MRVAIIGAGWFGCHIAASLIKKGIDVTIYEKNSAVFEGASHYNTGRLHLGFHYPRSAKTRAQSREGFSSFMQTYPLLCEDVTTNLYLVSSKESLIDFDTYLSILTQEKYEYSLIDPAVYGFNNIEGGLLCSEKAVNHLKAADYFTSVLKNNLQLRHEVKKTEQKGNAIMVDNEAFDYCINCTYYTFLPGRLSGEIEYESVVTLLLEPTRHFNEKAFVIMDGNFFSLNPYFTASGKVVYSLYHVTASVLHHSCDFNDALKRQMELNKLPFARQLDLDSLIEQIRYYYPRFSDELTPVGSFVSTRTKLLNNNANRECIVEQNGRAINVLSGKVNSIFEAAGAISNIICI